MVACQSGLGTAWGRVGMESGEVIIAAVLTVVLGSWEHGASEAGSGFLEQCPFFFMQCATFG